MTTQSSKREDLSRLLGWGLVLTLVPIVLLGISVAFRMSTSDEAESRVPPPRLSAETQQSTTRSAVPARSQSNGEHPPLPKNLDRFIRKKPSTADRVKVKTKTREVKKPLYAYTDKPIPKPPTREPDRTAVSVDDPREIESGPKQPITRRVWIPNGKAVTVYVPAGYHRVTIDSHGEPFVAVPHGLYGPTHCDGDNSLTLTTIHVQLYNEKPRTRPHEIPADVTFTTRESGP